MSNSENEFGASGLGIETKSQIVEMASTNILMESKTLKEVLETTVDKSGPKNNEFIYVDISSVDREEKKITTVKTLELSEAPSRAKQHLKEGDVLVSMTRPNLNAVAIVPSSLSGAIASTGFHVLRSDTVEPKFIYYLVQSKDFIEKMCQKVQGALYPAVRPRDIESYTFNLPSKKEQQHQIVAKIEELFSELDSGIASLKTAQQQLKIYRQSLLKHAFEGKLTEQWRKDNTDAVQGSTNAARGQEPVAAKLETPEQLLARIQTERETRYQQQLDEWKQAVKDWEAKGKEGKKPSKPKRLSLLKEVAGNGLVELSNLPVAWNYVRLGLLIDEPTYGTSAKCSYESEGVGVLRIPNITNGVIDDNDLKFARFDTGEVDHLALKKGDLLTIRSNGSISLVGTCAIIKEKDVKHIFAGYLIRLRPNQKLILPSFLLAAMSSHLLRQQIERAAKSTSGVNNINSGELQNLIIPIASIEEQKEIVNQLEEKLSIIEQNEKEIESALAKAELLRQSILKKAFNGQLVTSE